MMMLGDAARNGLRVIGIIGRFVRGGAKISDNNSLLLEMLFEGFLQAETAMIRAQRDGGFGGTGPVGALQSRGLFNEFQHRRNALLDLISAVEINFVGAPNGVADI